MQELERMKRQELRDLAKFLAVMGVRNNTELEDLHCGITPSSKTGDYADVKVISPYGEIEWNRLSRISDAEMRSLMLSVERAIEAALLEYANFSCAEMKILPERLRKLRTYDKQ